MPFDEFSIHPEKEPEGGIPDRDGTCFLTRHDGICPFGRCIRFGQRGGFPVTDLPLVRGGSGGGNPL